MGWLKLNARRNEQETTPKNVSHAEVQLKPSSEHVELVEVCLPRYAFAPLSLSDAELPFIPPEDVRSYTGETTGGLFIVVDSIVYNCSAFISEHPGGEQIIKSFAGAECSWQFWRFHGKKEMEEFGKALRVGRTKGLVNKYAEPSRFVGLRRLGMEWD